MKWGGCGNIDPLAKDGYIKLLPSDGVPLGEGVEELVIGIRQVQMEQVGPFVPISNLSLLH